jgi:molybdate transport system substrate-binding protein
VTARASVRILPALAFAFASFACESGEAKTDSGARIVEIDIFAASSLTGAFEEIGELFEEEHPNARVRFNFLASSDLAAQIEQGAPAHVFASADDTNMQRVVDAGVADGDPQVFARNKLEIIVPADNPGDVSALEDLARQDLIISLCNEECPAGRYALEIFDSAGIDVEADSLESEVKAVVTRVALGEADAGIAYVTDTKAAGGDVRGIAIPDDMNVTATYPIVALRDAPTAAGEFVDFVLGDNGQSVLAKFGFLDP